ncbi:unnamed protein product [Closterium sp. Naga37s-1]|nr:unnamed protein product [Closterium sp. Naga37s-1]
MDPRPMAPRPLAPRAVSAKGVCGTRAIGVGKTQVGKAQVFLRAGQMVDLNAMRAEKLGEAAKVIQRSIQKLDVEEAKTAEIQKLQQDLEGAMRKVDEAHAETLAAKAEIQVAKAETQAAKAEISVAKAETQTAKAETQAAKAEIQVAKAETQTAKAETRAAMAETQAAKAETQAAKAEAQTAKAETERLCLKVATVEAEVREEIGKRERLLEETQEELRKVGGAGEKRIAGEPGAVEAAGLASEETSQKKENSRLLSPCIEVWLGMVHVCGEGRVCHALSSHWFSSIICCPIRAPCISRAAYGRHSSHRGVPVATATHALSLHWGSIIATLTTLLMTLKANDVPSFLVRKLVTQIFSFINVQLFNSLLLRRECCSFSNGEYVKAGPDDLDHWLHEATPEYTGNAWEEIKYIRQSVGFLVIHQKPKESMQEITSDLCPALSTQQLYRISTMYWDDKYGTHTVSPSSPLRLSPSPPLRLSPSHRSPSPHAPMSCSPTGNSQ